jgi:hypothetical protein
MQLFEHTGEEAPPGDAYLDDGAVTVGMLPFTPIAIGGHDPDLNQPRTATQTLRTQNSEQTCVWTPTNQEYLRVDPKRCYMVPGTWYQVLDTRYLVAGCQALGTKYLDTKTDSNNSSPMP